MKKLSILTVLALFALASCTEEELQLPEEQVTIIEEAFMESTFEEVDDMTFAGLADNGGRIKNDGRFSCATVIKKTDSLIINFGDSCVGPHGRVRAGIIYITRTAPFWQKNAVITTTFENFSIDGNNIYGTRKIENLGLNENDNHMFKTTLSDGKIEFVDGSEIVRSSEFIKTWVRGANMMEDELHLTGNASGTNRKGIQYTMEIVDALIYKATCKHQGFPIAVKGQKIFTVGDKEISVDFGDGSCDNILTISHDGRSKDIEIDFHK